MSARVLIADDELNLRRVLSASLRREGYDVVTAANGVEAWRLLEGSGGVDGEIFDLLITDVRMPELDGMGLLAKAHKHFPGMPVVMLTAHGTVDMAVQALKEGAFDFVSKPYERDELHSVVKKAVAQKEASLDETHPDEDAPRNDLVGTSQRMKDVLAIVDRVADSPSTVLITGESGTGKELVAMALHKGSSRADKPFIRINVAAIPPTLIEAELFGHEKGAFTGAVTQKPGRFELADGGTLFLDEIGDLPVEMQVKLLRALQESQFERVGGIKTLSVDVRLIAATNRNLTKAIADERFREDLYYRLNVVPIALPPLRDRTGDIPLLAKHFIEKLAVRLKREERDVSDDAMLLLQSYSWPGNIRELENIIERTLLFADGPLIDVAALPPDIVAKVEGMSEHTVTTVATAANGEHNPDASMKDIVRKATADIEKALIVRALDETNGNVTHAARRLKISRKSLQIKMKEFGLRDDPPATAAVVVNENEPKLQ
ncbi:MAG: sigma-54-dependent Fis family transcriptional regulator [Deltaproteobacteria bacterium]|nr:sigma-54-dependent Fis family transcriptional regulator [Deltaproteobacteria bacterium]